jgi:hypothetical protein
MIGAEFLVGWSVGGFSMIFFGMAYDGWQNYIKALREAKCKCKEGEE